MLQWEISTILEYYYVYLSIPCVYLDTEIQLQDTRERSRSVAIIADIRVFWSDLLYRTCNEKQTKTTFYFLKNDNCGESEKKRQGQTWDYFNNGIKNIWTWYGVFTNKTDRSTFSNNGCPDEECYKQSRKYIVYSTFQRHENFGSYFLFSNLKK